MAGLSLSEKMKQQCLGIPLQCHYYEEIDFQGPSLGRMSDGFGSEGEEQPPNLNLEQKVMDSHPVSPLGTPFPLL